MAGSGAESSTASTADISATKDHYIRVNGVRVATSDTIVIYTDGSSLSNGKVGSQAGVGVFFGVNDPRNVSERLDGELQTNQRAELMAVYRALEVCGSDTAPIEIRTDSMYTVNIVTKWADGWIKNNWKRSDGEKVMNRDIIEPLIAKIKSRPGRIKWVSEYVLM
ncbi:ribonuclease H-like domain-containing protein [Dissophora ornata]|nr:ribonuclease H-like domain-containing protein [Dissophora ornata]